MDPAVRIEGLSKRYLVGTSPSNYGRLTESVWNGLRGIWGTKSRSTPRELWALSDINLEIREGEIYGVIGRNGAGKSTLLKVLSRITEPTRGEIALRGRVASLLEVGTGFHPELTGHENVFLNGALLGMSRREIAQKFDEIVDFAEIERFMDTPIKRYSSGMYVRLAFSVAAHLEPEILIIDEVLSVGDTFFQIKCIEKMSSVARSGRTLIFVSHNMSAIANLCTRACVLDEGKVVKEGAVEECVQTYLQTGLESRSKRGLLQRAVSPDAPLEIMAVTLSNSKSPVILNGQPLEVELTVNCRKATKNVVFGWGVHSPEGIRLFEARSAERQGYAQLEPGAYVIRSTLVENPLNEGLYSLHVGARSSEGGLDYLPDVIFFRVEPQRQLKSLWLERVTAPIRVDPSWDIETIDPLP